MTFSGLDLFGAVLIALFLGFIAGIIIGEFDQFRFHRQYCDCVICSRWRKETSEKAVKKSAEGL